jgi:transposase
MPLSLFTKSQIITLYEEDYTQAEISEKLSVHKSTVSRTISRYKERGTLEPLKKSGCPKAVEKEDFVAIEKILIKNPKTSLRKCAVQLLVETGKDVSYTTVRNSLNEHNIFAYSPVKKPLLTKRHMQLRKEKSAEMLKLSDEDIKSIIFSDESKFNMLQSDGKVSVWRQPGTGLLPRNITPTLKFGGGSVMVWGCISYHGVGKLVFIEETMDAALYVNILANNLQESAELMGLDAFIFQQDNDPKHTSKLAKAYFEDEQVPVLSWPPQSPDMNPIEAAWAIVKDIIRPLKPKNKEEHKANIRASWESISKETCKKLCMGFKDRVFAVYRANGGHTKY